MFVSTLNHISAVKSIPLLQAGCGVIRGVVLKTYPAGKDRVIAHVERDFTTDRPGGKEGVGDGLLRPQGGCRKPP